MYLCRFSGDGWPRLGARLDEGSVVDLEPVLDRLLSERPPHRDPAVAFIEAGDRARELAENLLDNPSGDVIHSLDDIHLLAPLEPTKIRNFSVYEGHIRNAVNAAIEMRAGRAVAGLNRLVKLAGPPRAWFRRPLYYKGNHTSVIGPYDDIVRPAFTTQLDYELELAVVIGAPGKDLDDDTAMRHVFGYTILNDVSARDILPGELFSRMGPAKGKDFDTGNVIGPWLVTQDEIADPYALRGEIRVNGEQRASCTTGDMHHTIARMLVEASRGETLVPGELIGTGCCSWGSGLEIKQFLHPGDVVELSLGPLGAQRNRVTT